jgi:hypothetical protein
VTARLALGGLGGLLMAYGALLALTRQDPGQLVEVAIWLAAGVAIHDGLLAGSVLLVGLAGRRLLPAAWRAPAAVALVVWGSLTIAVVPVLGRFGARPDNPTLLDRPYATAWSALFAATIVAVVLLGAWRARRSTGRTTREAD